MTKEIKPSYYLKVSCGFPVPVLSEAHWFLVSVVCTQMPFDVGLTFMNTGPRIICQVVC